MTRRTLRSCGRATMTASTKEMKTLVHSTITMSCTMHTPYTVPHWFTVCPPFLMPQAKIQYSKKPL